MSRGARFVVFGIGGLALLALLVTVSWQLPEFGSTAHPYRDQAVPAAVARQTSNAVSSVNFDQRALDTLGEETILLGSVLGAVSLLRRGREERPRRPPERGHELQAIQLAGYLILGVTLLTGINVIAHGTITPGGGFQGGVVVGTGIHLVYVAGSYPALRRVRPLAWCEITEAAAAATFVLVGIAGLVVAGGFLANFLPHGRFSELNSGGTVALLNIAVGAEVAAGVVVLLAQFLDTDMASAQRSRKQVREQRVREQGEPGRDR